MAQKKLWVYFHLGLLYSVREPRTKDRDMGFFSDLAMGFGAKPKTKDYIARTARTIARNEGKKSASESGRARRYQAQYGVTAADIGNTKDMAVKKTRPKDKPLSNIKTVPTTTKAKPSDIAAGREFAESMKKANELAKAGKLPKGSIGPIRNLAGSPSISQEEAKAAGANIGTGYDPKTKTGYTDTAGEVLETGPSKYGLQNTLIGKGISYLAGVRGDDKIVNTVGGKPIFQRADGSFYAFDAVGLPYDIADPEVGTAPSTLDVDPEVRERQLAMMNVGSTDDDDRPASTEVVAEKAPDDPCPEGYRMNPETKQCELDPFKQPFADAVTTPPAPVMTSNLSPYTQMAPVTLGQLQPTRVAAANPLAMQQANMPPAGGLGSLAPVLNRTS
tara:strand:+ start:1460 stop:2626 length:1167 start_codon:yes stop_codon:yes gene_type:complete